MSSEWIHASGLLRPRPRCLFPCRRVRPLGGAEVPHARDSLCARWISQKTTPRPDGVSTDALTVSPAEIILDQRPPRTRSTNSPTVIGVSSPRLTAAPSLSASPAASRHPRRQHRETLRHIVSHACRAAGSLPESSLPPSPWLRSSSRTSRSDGGRDLAPWRSIANHHGRQLPMCAQPLDRPVPVGLPKVVAQMHRYVERSLPGPSRSRASGRAPPPRRPPGRRRGER